MLDDLESRGWLSEARFVEQMTAARRTRFGAGRILLELQEKGVSEAALESARNELRGSEIEAARAVWAKKFGRLPANLQERARQSRFLAGRGFSAATVRAILKGRDEDQ